jgi:signal transduction histidine kinase/ActR/RegA family two-component response regulator
MKLDECWTEIEAVPHTAAMHDVFDRIRNNPSWPFLPVVDAERHPIGVVREYDLKNYAYARFGRELIKNRPLTDFLKPSLILPTNTSMEELLSSSAKNSNPDGIILTENGKYRAVLLTDVILHMFEEQHLATEVRLVQAQKMEAIGTLAGGIAHDLNNILTPILGYTEMMKLLMAQGEPIQPDMLDQVCVSAKRAREIVKQILVISRHQTSERHPMCLGPTIREAIRLLRSSLPSTIEIEMRLTVRDDHLVMANPTDIHRVVLNLCTNAYHAMREGGALQVVLEHHEGPLMGWSLQNAQLTGNYLRLSISDTGTGIAPHLLPRIFEPFFTTKKQEGEGTGLGLSVTNGIISNCKGVISVESELGKGSTFHVYIPCLDQKSPSKDIIVPATAFQPAGGEILSDTRRSIKALMVDDEFAITQLAGRLLPKYGIALETENDSVKALKLFRERATEFDLLITDQVMPGITGMELIERVLEIRPGLPIVLCTGYSETVSFEQAKGRGVRECLLKPLNFQQLAALIKQLVPPLSNAAFQAMNL